jgi:carboxyl-terminal processing protease
MLPASNRGAGMNFGFPDVVNTVVGPATVPVPYPNFAQNATATGFAMTVYVGMVNALNVGSSMPMTQGDEAGMAGPHMGKGSYVAGNPIVSVEKLPAMNLCMPALGNNGICGLDAALVPSVSVVSFTQRAGVGNDAAELFASLAARPGTFSRDGDALVCEVHLVTRDLGRLLVNELAAQEAERPVSRVVLDLRGCPGGDLEGAVELASCFLEAGAPVGRFVDVDGDEETLVARAVPERFTGEVLVLVDAGTASAAEVLARALEDAGGDRVRVQGGPTFGKRSVAGLRGGSMASLGEVVRIEG